MNKSQTSSLTSHDNSFNFKNELDISNGKRDKTGEMFFKQVFDFDDFQNIGDNKTVKSSNYKTKNNTSNILKRQMDEYSNRVLGNSILDEMNNTGFNTKPVIQGSIRKIYYDQQKVPNFGGKRIVSQQNEPNNEPVLRSNYNSTNQNANFRASDLSYTKSNIQAQMPSGASEQNKNIILQMNSKILQKEQNKNFKKKQEFYQEEVLLSKQQEYRQLISLINFYKNEAQKMNYQRTTVDQSTKQLILMINSQTYEEQIRNNLESINSLNVQIEKQRGRQKKLSRVICELEEEYNQIIESVNQMDFRRPVIIKDEAKVIIDQINQLKAQFQTQQRDNGQLNLSCTIQRDTPNSIQKRLGNSPNNHPHQEVIHIKEIQQNDQQLVRLFQEIYQQNQSSQDSQYLRNLKLSCLKNEWQLFSNKQLIISTDFNSCPVIKFKIGNKTNQLLKGFTIQIKFHNYSIKLLENQVLNKKSFLVQGFQIDAQYLNEIFFKLIISYEIQSQGLNKKESKQLRLFCPTGILNFGSFQPLTFKQFQTQMSLPLQVMQSPLKPLDRNLINQIEQTILYIPNLRKWEGEENKVYGLFMSVFNQGTLVIIQGYGDLLKLKLKNGNKCLLKLLEFILTV